MKLLTIFVFSLFLIKGCNNDKALDAAEIEYTANSRGFYQNIVVKNKVLTVLKNRENPSDRKEISLSDAQWKNLVDIMALVDLEQIPALVAPTEKRFYDGAAIAEFKVMVDGKTYQSTAFDHGNPPMELERIINEILKYSQTK